MRRTLLLLCLIWTTIGRADSPTTLATESLATILAAQKFVTFSMDRESAVYRLGLLDEDQIKASTEYYENRAENIAKYRELSAKVQKSRIHLPLNRSQASAFLTPERQPPTELELEMKKYARPTGAPVGEVTRFGSDFIAIRELDSTTEYLIPFSRILDVAIPKSLVMNKQTPKVEPIPADHTQTGR